MWHVRLKHSTPVLLTHGTAEEGLDFVSVLQPVPHTGKQFQFGYLNRQVMDANKDREGGGD